VALKVSGPEGTRENSWEFTGGVNVDVSDMFSAPTPGEPAKHDVAITIDNNPLGNGSEAFYLEMKDTTPPDIKGVTLWADGDGGFYLEAKVVDNCAVASVTLNYSSSSGGGGSIGMASLGEDHYGAAVRLPRVGYNTFTIVATDAAGNSSSWSTHIPSTYSGAFGFGCLKRPGPHLALRLRCGGEPCAGGLS